MPLHHTEEDLLVKTLHVNFQHDSATTIALGTLPANSFVIKSETVLHTFFNGTSPTIEVGTPSDKDFIYNTSHINLKTGSGNNIDVSTHFAVLSSSDETIQIDYIADGSTAGSGTVVIYYI